jgi:uncharacterized membrane protein
VVVELVAFVGSVLALIITTVIRAGMGTSLAGILVVSAVADVLLFVITNFLQIGLYRSTLAVTAGQPIDIGRVFSAEGAGPYLLGSVLYGLMVGVGTLLCIVPGIALAFFGFFWPYFVLDGQQDAVTAIKSSFRLVNGNLGQMIPFAILAFLLYAVGFVICGIGVLVTAPIALLAVAYAYRSMTGQRVAP